MGTTSSPDDAFAGVVGPNTAAAATEQLSEWGDQLASHDHSKTEQLADYARPTKPRKDDPHANDPSKTTTIQRSYARKLRGRFADIRAEIRRGVEDRDVLSVSEDTSSSTSLADLLAAPELPDDVHDRFVELLADQEYAAARDLVEQLADFDPDELVGRDFNFEQIAEKHSQFMEWLREQQEKGVLEVISRGDNTYVRKAYERGIRNQHQWMDDVSAGVDVDQALSQPIHQNRLSLLYQRNFEALKGITDDVAREISRELAEGLTEGVGPGELASRLTDRVDAIGRTRATTLARTEVMYSHNEASISEAERLVGEDVELEIESEVSTAGDTHVCDICEPWDGRRLSPKEAREVGPPFHPRCRCIVRTVTTKTDSSTPAQAAS